MLSTALIEVTGGLAPTHRFRDRKFADSLLEETRFEPSVPSNRLSAKLVTAGPPDLLSAGISPGYKVPVVASRRSKKE